MRKRLKHLRVVENNFSQAEMAAKIGVSRGIYAQVESGTREASTKFLTKLQKAFAIPDSEIWNYLKDYND